jgi:dTDP-4-dehydrorhamnose 3,5-epimerase-like enzyme
MKLETLKFKEYSDKTGSLVPFYKKINLKKFKIVRFFFLYGKLTYGRANHAHKKCNQILIPVNGKTLVEITTTKGVIKKFILSKKNKKYLFVPIFHWIKITFLEKKSILLTLCDYKYDKDEYIQNINNFYKK